MGRAYRLDDKLLIISLIFLTISVISIGLSIGDILTTGYLEFIIMPSLSIYGITFTLFLYYNHKLEKEKVKRESRVEIKNPYKSTFYFGLFIFFIGLIGSIIEFHFILTALIWGGLFAIVYSLVGKHDLARKKC